MCRQRKFAPAPWMGILFLFLFGGSFSAQQMTITSPPPGTYADEIILQNVSGSELVARFLDHDLEPFDFSEPILLSALPGQEKSYRIQLESQSQGLIRDLGVFEYLIDRKPPLSPRIQPYPGLYRSPLALEIQGEGRLEIRVNGILQDGSGEGLVLNGRAGQSVDYNIRAYSTDSVGNQSQVLEARYQIDRRTESSESPALAVLSPQPGNYLNPQYFHVQHRGLTHVYYSLDGSDPLESGSLFTGGLELSGQDLQLNVAGLAADGRVLRESISFSAGTQAYQGVRQGLVSSPVEILPLYSGMTYTTLERIPSSFDPGFERALRISPQLNTLRSFVLRLRRAGVGEYRMFFLLEGRALPSPRFSIQREDALGNLSYPDPEHYSVYDLFIPLAEPGYRILASAGGRTIELGEARSILSIASELGNLPSLLSATDSFQFDIHYGSDSGIIGPSVRLRASAGSTLAANIGLEEIQGGAEVTVQGEAVYYSFSELPEALLAGKVRYTVPAGYREEGRVRFWSVRSDGRPGDLLLEQDFMIDNQYPPGPRIVLDARSVSIDSTNPAFYRISSSRPDAPSLTRDFLPYTGPFDLLPIPGANVVYRLEAYSELPGGERSTMSRSTEIYVNEVPATPPRIIGISEGQIWSDPELSFALANREPGFLYEFRLLLGDEEVQSGEIEGGRIAVHLAETEADAQLRILSSSRELPSKFSQSLEINFRVDRIAPLPPLFQGPAEGARSNQALSLVLQNPAPQDSIIVYRLGPEADEEIYAAPIALDTAPDTTRVFQIEARTLDQAGNRSEPIYRTVTIDKEAPRAPEIRISSISGEEILLPDSRLLHHNQDLILSFEGEGEIYYETASAGATPGIPAAHSPRYQGPLEIRAEDGQETRLSVLARSVDDLGNWSGIQRLVELWVDKQAPTSPPSPRVSRDGNAGILEWLETQDPVYYRFSSQSEFRRFDGPVSWTIPPGAESIQIIYKAVDGAGNQSQEVQFSIPRRNQTERPLLGSREVASLGTDMPEILVGPSRPGALVRFEVILDGREGDVSETSPIWDPEILAPPLDGETLHYILVFRQFEQGFEPSEPLTLSFTVDRTPPLPPLSTSPDKSLHREPSSLALESLEGEILYRITEERIDGLLPPAFEDMEDPGLVTDLGQYLPYQKEILLQGRAGEAIRYKVYGISRDEAGNSSTRARVWEVIVDRASLYVQAGSPSGDGSKEAPFPSLDQAIAAAKSGEAKRLFVGRGVYTIEDWIGPNGQLSINGGFDADWNWAALETLVVPGSSFRRNSLVSLDSGDQLELNSLYLTDPRGGIRSLLEIQGGSLGSRRDLTLASTGSFMILSATGAARVELHGSTIINYESALERLIEVTGQSLLGLYDSRIEYREAPAFLRTTDARLHISIYLEDSSIELERTEIGSQISDLGSSLYLSGSEARILGGKIFIPRSKELSLGIHAVNSRLDLDGLSIQGSTAAGISALLRLDGGSLSADRLELLPAARDGSSAIVARDATVRLHSSTYLAGSAEEYITLNQFSSSQVDFRSNIVSGNWRTAELIFASLESVQGVWYGNRLGLVNSGSTLGFHLVRGGDTEILENEVESSDSSVAIYLADPASVIRVENNRFRGWDALLVKSSMGETTAITGESVFSDILSLEAETEDGQIFSGNRIDQGL